MKGLFGDTDPAQTVGLGMRIESVDEFNRRALAALSGVRFAEGSDRTVSIVNGCRTAFNRRQPLTDSQQLALYSITHRYRAQITDVLVRDYAASHTKGAD